MKETDIKDRLYQQFSRIGKCLSSDKRLEIMDILSNGPKSVEGLATQTGMNVANVSRHLQILLDAKLVKCYKKGTYVIYSIGDPLVIEFLSSLWRICEDRLSDIKQIKTELELQYPEVQTITKHDLLEKMKKKTVILLDIRPTDEYDASHIPDAISIPLDQLENYLKTVNKSTIELAAYCRGPYCSLASQAVDYMLKQGYMAYRIEEGVHDWNVCEDHKYL
ncbi:metalloregulator ArsR/SmtB family transcription factor [Paenibacillus sp. P2(2022)]|uniref:ArsR/SmtB family transcription factor n=1 Tax=Paenibacillus TaxID=44249 RepID=UPI0005ED223A|nr:MULTISPECIES: metalloregulator ArsR/SmtB family transcription factor [Paenibacillus]AUS26814.1 ArsR family transcriptional regulator [Paenibacillus polymyxa]KJK30991.1 ArsR family transcriptional regulator [Paenibacillus polymyxa]MDG0053347.1 metalloregulator ArsR/SmtB family transcription factor [Paenibacillus sp. P2(2022)]WOZ36209.1 metalloregulator ArsR/SmtB family transcription factor [Paenibacillus polymyxa]